MSVSVSAIIPDTVEVDEVDEDRAVPEISIPLPTVSDIEGAQDFIESSYARSELVNLMKMVRRKSIVSEIKAQIFKALNLSFLIFLILCNGAIFIVSSTNPCRDNLPVIVLSGITTTITTLYGTLGPGGRGTHYKQISVRLRGMYRTARESFLKLNNTNEIIELVGMNTAELDQMDVSIYNMGLGNR